MNMTDEDAVLRANAAYYRAFGAGDFAAMSAIWAQDDVSCIHPGWSALIGRRAILESYFEILSNPNQPTLSHRDEVVLISGREARVFCIEVVVGMRLAATNWFRQDENGWRMIHHQASVIGPVDQEGTEPASGRRLN